MMDVQLEVSMHSGAGPMEEDEPKAPYFYYRDHSSIPDPDPTKPVTIPGRIPTFPAKLFAILSRQDLSDIVSWMPHGRSWKVHKPREFEVKVIPQYFDHNKFSSFIRQANGWGFKRVCAKGADRNSHYHELFLRGIPHLIKFMKRPVSGSKIVNQQPLHSKGKNCDPDFYRISDDKPLPEFSHKMMHPLDESTFLNPGNHNPNRAVLGSQVSNCGRPPISMQSVDTSSIAQLQAFFTQTEESKKQPAVSSSQVFLLPRVPENQQHQQHQHQAQQESTHSPLAPLAATSSSCPIREQEKELDPLTILLNDVYDEHLTIEDPIIQSLISDPTVPPPSSLFSYYTPPASPPHLPMEQKAAPSHSGMIQHHPQQVLQPVVQVVSPVEEKQIMEMPEPVPFRSHMYSNDDMHFDDPFAGGLMAENFW